MKISIRDRLPFITVKLVYQDKELEIKKVLIDTGSAGTIFSSDRLATIGLVAEPNDPLRQIRGVGGTEFVFIRRIDTLAIADLEVKDFEIEIGIMDYGFEIEGLVGMDFLIQSGAVIDLAELEVKKGVKGANSI